MHNEIIILVWLAVNTILCGIALGIGGRYNKSGPISQGPPRPIPPAAKEYLVPSGGRLTVRKKVPPKCWDDEAAYLREIKDKNKG